MKKYCDTNILTGSINKQNLSKKLGNTGFNRFKNEIKGFRSSGEEKLKKIDQCVISRGVLLRDIGRHLPSLGAVLTSSNIKNIEIRNIKKGFREGKKYYDKACAKKDVDKAFYKKFCQDKKLKTDLNLSEKNDVSHFGSAIKIGAEKFITANGRDFKELEKVSNIMIE